MFGIGMPELLIIAGVIVLIFGPSQLPKLGRNLGQGIREFRNIKHALKEGQEEIEGAAHAAKDVVNTVKREIKS